jgi:hypothetical protein
MYSTCLFCHTSLGTNEVIEQFPIGRRLAFDGARGRLWVLCRRCGGWNLTPLEERWEAIEECERRFRGTTLRVSTDHIGVTRLPEGLDLVRIGEALRPELAAWRYGSRLVRRRWRTAAVGTATVGAMVGSYALLHSFAIAGGGGALLSWGTNGWTTYWHRVRVAIRVPGQDGIPVPVTVSQVSRAAIIGGGTDGSGWNLILPHRKPGAINPWRSSQAMSLTGSAAVRAAGLILPRINEWGASRKDVVYSAKLLEQHGVEGLDRLVARARGLSTGVLLREVARPFRLALEMAAHEESERRAMEGELADLEAAWRDAEEIAAIADNMFLPASVDAFLHRHRITSY